jgi:DNA processing protein
MTVEDAADVTGDSGTAAVSTEELLARAAWSRIAEPGDVTASRLVAARGPVQALADVAAAAHPGLARFLPRLEQLDGQRDVDVAAQLGARVVCPGDAQWPSGLDDLDCPPFCLWVRGDVDLAEVCARSVAVVGARSATAYGEMVATEMAAGLGERGFTVVSGAAFGIDAAAHRGALALGSPTLAVLAGGVDRPYPSAHARLIDRIREVGAVLSEVPPGSAPTRPRFLQRNRMIATMTQGTVVIEAGLRSGSLNTARTAAEHQRVVVCVPGPVTSMMSAGCHQAVRDGVAVLVTDAAEAADAIGEVGQDLALQRRAPERPGDDLDEPAARVLAALPVRRGVTVARLTVVAGLPATTVVGVLGRLELTGLAEREGQGWRQGPVARARRHG